MISNRIIDEINKGVEFFMIVMFSGIFVDAKIYRFVKEDFFYHPTKTLQH